MLFIAIPCKYENNILKVKSLGFEAKGNSPDQALLTCIKETPLYIPLMLAKFRIQTDSLGRKFQYLEVPFDNLILKRISELEPTVEEKKKKIASSVETPTSEEILKWGF